MVNDIMIKADRRRHGFQLVTLVHTNPPRSNRTDSEFITLHFEYDQGLPNQGSDMDPSEPSPREQRLLLGHKLARTEVLSRRRGAQPQDVRERRVRRKNIPLRHVAV